MKLRHANCNKIPACSTCHMSHERAVLDLIALHKHDTQWLFLSCEKKSISNLHVEDMPLNELTICFFYRAVLPDLSHSRQNQTNLRTGRNHPVFIALCPRLPICLAHAIWISLTNLKDHFVIFQSNLRMKDIQKKGGTAIDKESFKFLCLITQPHSPLTKSWNNAKNKHYDEKMES